MIAPKEKRQRYVICLVDAERCRAETGRECGAPFLYTTAVADFSNLLIGFALRF